MQLGYLPCGQHSYGVVNNLGSMSLVPSGVQGANPVAVTEVISFSFAPGHEVNPASWSLG